ncbi:Phosphatidylinositol transfer protein [Histomonas meleagridis]|uniref:Phosphatidylinositol transfer protein n=1 Tax=Histomonas meleagridis TaxID=135588 RepID=UPI00355A1899|nr:Phosphatidylinositol transfer protein [Histomonas meleagridis]KAH0798900.1 Phosphatidylinositol transfer protein [Histomonas meleagridis]
MKIYEFRIILPTSVTQYKIGNLYMTAQRSKEESEQVKGEGIETITNEPFQNENESGQYTYKIMHFKTRIPAFLRWALPDKYCHCHEKSWNSYPHYHTEYAVPGLGDDFLMEIDSQHFPYEKNGKIPENALNLSKKELKKRKIVYLDILDSKPKPDKSEYDLHGFVCPEAGITTPLQGSPKRAKANEEKPPLWSTHYDGEMMIAIKVVKFMFHWKGLQTIAEKFAMNTFYHNLFLDTHRQLMRLADKWYPMTIDDVRAFENQIIEESRQLEFDRDEDKEDEEIPDKPPEGIQIPPEEPSTSSS